MEWKCVEVQVPVPQPSFPVPKKSISQPAQERRRMKRKTRGASDDYPGAPNLPVYLVDRLIQLCDLWIACGHEIKAVNFIGRLADCLQKKLKDKSESSSTFIPDRFGGHFLDRCPELKEKLENARKGRKEDSGEEWESQLRDLVPHYQFKPECAFCAMEMGFILEKMPKLNNVTIHRPRDPRQKRREIASTIVLTSMSGELFPSHAVIRKENESPQRHRLVSNVKIASNADGWASSVDWFHWLTNEFEQHTKKFAPDESQWRFLLINDFLFRMDESFFVECFSRNILCVTTPRSSETPLPCDLDPFAAGTFMNLSKVYQSFVKTHWRTLNGAENIILNREQIARFFEKITLEEEELQMRRIETSQAWRKSVIFTILTAKTSTCSTLAPSATTGDDSDYVPGAAEIEYLMMELCDQARNDDLQESDDCVSSPSRMLGSQTGSSDTIPSSPTRGRARPPKKVRTAASTDREIINQLDNQIQTSATLDELNDFRQVGQSDLRSSSLTLVSSPVHDGVFHSDAASVRQSTPSPGERPEKAVSLRREYDVSMDDYVIASPNSKRGCRKIMHKKRRRWEKEVKRNSKYSK